MTFNFYDVKEKKKVETEVLGKVVYEKTNEKTGKTRTSYAFRGQTADGRPMITFVSKDVYEQAVDVPVVE